MTQQLAERPTQQPDLRSLVQSEKVKQQLMDALPKFITADQFAVIVRTSVNQNPKLMECTPESFMVSILKAAQMGILPDGRNGHLIPRWNGRKNCMECTFQSDYKGLVGLVRGNDRVSDVYADVVREHDVFRVIKGLHRDLIHEIDIRKDRGAILGAYAVIQYKDGTPSFDFMDRSEIEAVRDRSDSWKSHVKNGYDTPWKTDEGEMFKKTVIRRLLKLADLSPDTHQRLAIETDMEVRTEHAPRIERPVIGNGQPQAQLQSSSSDTAATVVEEQSSSDAAVQSNAQDVTQVQTTGTHAQETTTAEAPAAKKAAPKPLTRKATAKTAAAAPVETEKPAAEQQHKSTEVQKMIEEINARLEENGTTNDDLMRVIRDNKWCDTSPQGPKHFAELGEKKLRNLVTYLDDLCSEMLAHRVRALMVPDGFTDKEVVTAAVQNDWTKAGDGAALGEIGIDVLKGMIGDWENVRGAVTEIRETAATAK